MEKWWKKQQENNEISWSNLTGNPDCEIEKRRKRTGENKIGRRKE